VYEACPNVPTFLIFSTNVVGDALVSVDKGVGLAIVTAVENMPCEFVFVAFELVGRSSSGGCPCRCSVTASSASASLLLLTSSRTTTSGSLVAHV
jgi:hypothetical protein